MVVDAAGDPVPAGDGQLEILPTPGHSPDHLCFFDREAGDLYCGDLARKGGTIVIPARKGGDLRAYLASLRLVRDLAPRRLLPGHGPIVDDPAALIDEYIAHRQKREQQILQAILGGRENGGRDRAAGLSGAAGVAERRRGRQRPRASGEAARRRARRK